MRRPGLYANCPFRTVVHIEDSKPGPRGGEAWWLTLECGHFAARAKPSRRPGIAAIISRFFRRPAFAPEKVRCLACGARPDEGADAR